MGDPPSVRGDVLRVILFHGFDLFRLRSQLVLNCFDSIWILLELILSFDLEFTKALERLPKFFHVLCRKTCSWALSLSNLNLKICLLHLQFWYFLFQFCVYSLDEFEYTIELPIEILLYWQLRKVLARAYVGVAVFCLFNRYYFRISESSQQLLIDRYPLTIAILSLNSCKWKIWRALLGLRRHPLSSSLVDLCDCFFQPHFVVFH